MELDHFKVNGFTVTIDHDPETDNPHDSDVPGAGLVMGHRRYEWPNDAGISFDDYAGWEQVERALREHHGAVVTAPVYVYEHSGIAFHVGEPVYPFNDPWDSGQAGFAYVTRKIWADTQTDPWEDTPANREQARALIKSEVEEYGAWANGETYYYTITDEYGDVVESVGGHIGWEWVTEAATEAANGMEHENKCSGYLDRDTGTVEHSGPCKLHTE